MGNIELDSRTAFELALIKNIRKNVSRLKHRIWRDVRLFRLLKNFRQVLVDEWQGRIIRHLCLRNGVELECPETGHLWFMFHEIWVYRLYEAPGYQIGRGDLVIDIGANIGVFATFAATRAEDVRVMAFEPFPGSVAQMRKNVRSSGLRNVEIYEKAVAGKSSRSHLNVVPGNWMVHALSDQHEESNSIEVECTTLDEILESAGHDRCNLLKLDCEGAEYEILQQASDLTLQRIRRIVLEYHEPGVTQPAGKTMCALLGARGFAVDRLIPSSGSGIILARNATGAPFAK